MFIESGQQYHRMENKEVEIRLFIPGNDLFAKKVAKNFEEATDDEVRL